MVDRSDYIPLEDAKKFIVNALDQYDPDLAVRAASILYDEARLNIVEVDQSKTNMMQCRPAGITIEDLKAVDMYMPDFVERFGPHFIRQDNPADHAIIDFEYNGTLHSVVWLAHETGHAIADDIQRGNGHSFKDFSPDEAEEQAYFVQHIVSGHLKATTKKLDIQDENLGQDVLKMSWDRACQYTNAGRLFETALSKSPTERREITLRALGEKLKS